VEAPPTPRSTPAIDEEAIYRISRPAPKLLGLYFLRALVTLPLFPIFFLLYLRIYLTLKFEFTNESVTMSWGRLWRKEVYLTYARIQDIHVSRDLFQRWLGLGTVHVQTASGSMKPEMSIDGLLEYEMVRDFLYSRMRGAQTPQATALTQATGSTAARGSTSVLEEIRDELRSIRKTLESRGGDQ
jgi:putative membrane protein